MFSLKKEEIDSREKRMQSFWEKKKIFEKSLENRKGSETFTFYDGPPFATGLPHYGHLLAGTIKDVIPRYKTMKGFLVPRRFGWDCHGLPVENEIEKAKSLSGAPSIEEFGIANFNEECRSIVLRFVKEWKSTVFRMGRWVDFDNPYKTMDVDFMESVWWVFSKLWEKGLVYQGYKVMPVSAQLGTPLSNFEANSNYKDVDDPSITVKFALKSDKDTHLLVWTTTPWTLPSNLAVIVHPLSQYVKIRDFKTKEKYILSKKRLKSYYKEEEEYEVLEEFLGETLVGEKYEPLFSYFSKQAEENAFKVLADDFVGEDDGSGIVHAAPAFGEFDFFICRREGIEPVCPVDQNCRFTKEVPEYEGLFVKDADKDIIKRIKAAGRMFKHTQVRHRYPYCYRSDTPLIYKTVTTWFVAVEKIKDDLVASNKNINWLPGHIKDGRFGKWLENARDWAVSRNRYWGTPIPIWRSDDGDIRVIGSKEELEKRTGQSVHDLHRHFIDPLTFEEDGKVFKRVPEVFDCWFESGSMPYAQRHHPFENQETFQAQFPADFIAEGLDQTRGWFYTLNVLSTALYGKNAFKNAIVNGIVLASDGQKMSKRLKNYPDPSIVIEKYGADAIRLYLMHSPVVQAEDFRFSEQGVETTLRQILIPLWNVYTFLSTYANIYEWKPDSSFDQKPKADIDRWIISRLHRLIEEVDSHLSSYDLVGSVSPLVGFVDLLTNWYIRRCRSRFWEMEDTKDRREAFATLHYVLKEFTKITAPFIPFISEAIYQEIIGKDEKESVHLCDYPKSDKEYRDYALEDQMELVQEAVSLGHSLRKEHKLRVRQPLKRAVVLSSNEDLLKQMEEQTELIKEELNVKEVNFDTAEESFVEYQILPNYKTLGRKAGKHMKALRAKVEAFDKEVLSQLEKGEKVQVSIDDQVFELQSEDVEIRRKAKDGMVALSSAHFTITLETAIDAALLREGFARELVNKINTIRKQSGFEVTDRVHVQMDTSSIIQESFENHKDYVCGEVLAKSVTFQKCEGEEWDLNGEKAKISLTKV